MVTERGILMSAPMVLATLGDRKSQTRRTRGLEEINVSPDSWSLHLVGRLDQYVKKTARGKYGAYFHRQVDRELQVCPVVCPYGQPGDRLWVKETFQVDPVGEWGTCYRASGHNPDCKFPFHLWRPSIFMPRKLSRITLEITGVRVERVNDISEADAIAEGTTTKTIDCRPGYAHREAFQELWDSINGKRPGCSWSDNPFCWCIEFKRVTEPCVLMKGE